uniref:Uncharacterized protein n=1 Tax=Phlebia radiata TaxID=5308 RepID=L8B9D9_PHLRA|nr:hypothetical protein PRA_mt0066 [Phlebia radiata]YP_007374974.1 hypothetical protein PRA_mt0192 [Phlebia radiata]CCE89187.1 hypothetical protein PRA_mt0066 [Phlebia radiata]CCE89252.1 hypothetical protein PRA_mt0192 [Phlebia radiata]
MHLLTRQFSTSSLNLSEGQFKNPLAIEPPVPVNCAVPTLLDNCKITSSRKIEGPILDAHFTPSFSPWFIPGFTDAEGNFDFVFIK